MFARFFIDRPIAAWVLSIVIVFAGAVAYFSLPIAQYPEITPPTVQVTCVYPGANATVVRDTVAAPIEQQVNGVERMMYMSSQSGNDGSYVLTVTFELGTDLNMAQVLVQNRVAQALSSLPDAVQQTGVTTKKRSPSILLVVNLYSEIDEATRKPKFDQLFLSNWATIQVRDELSRLPGVGDVAYLGQQDYSMRIWLDPDRLATRNLTAGDVVKALREQNVQVAAGAVGRQPVPAGQDFQLTMSTTGRLVRPEQFSNIVVRAAAPSPVTTLQAALTGNSASAAVDTAVVYLRDVGRVELGSKALDQGCYLDGKPSVGLPIFQLPGSNALDTARLIKEKMVELSRSFPEGLKYDIVYDTTPFIDESVKEVIHTLRDAFVLVAIVVLLFLQDWKAMIIPLIDVAVSLVGTFAVMKLMGFSLNNLTLFGLVLAIGIVVDDAIVVLENIERWIAMGYPVRAATIHAMDEITGPIIGITLVLSSVFIPSAFIPGITGQFYKQFALTIAVSMLISAINAMTMTPARATAIFKGGHHAKEALPWWFFALLGGYLMATLCPDGFYERIAHALGDHAPTTGEHGESSLWANLALFALGAAVGGPIGWLIIKPVNYILGKLFTAFNKGFDAVTRGYGALVRLSLRLSVVVLIVYGGLLALTYYGFTRMPVGFIPQQDKGYLIVNIQLPDSASLERTIEVTKKAEKIAMETPGIIHTVSNPGQSFVIGAIASNLGTMFTTLEPFHKRAGVREKYAEVIAAKLRRRFAAEIPEAVVLAFGAPAVDGLGSAGGFKIMVEDRGNLGLDMLAGQADALADRANRTRGLVGVFNGFRANTPSLFVDIDRVKCKSLGVGLSEVFDALQVYMGGAYVNDFNFEGRTWQVNVQAAPSFRVNADLVKQMKVRNVEGKMLPLGSVCTIRDDTGPLVVTRYNMYTAAPVNGASLPGVSTGQIIGAMERLAADNLSQSMQVEWTELTYLQKIAGNTAIFAFIGAVVLVFLVLSFLYESWSQPFAVILVVPMCLLCSLAGVALARMDVNIFVQVGFVVLVGLASKNAILVVEFARDLQTRQGKTPFDAAVEASTVRLRPIIMTSFAFILGVFPLVIGTGAGAEMRRTLGTAVFSGMLGVTFFGLFLTPVFYYVVIRLAGDPAKLPGGEREVPPPPAVGTDGHVAAQGIPLAKPH